MSRRRKWLTLATSVGLGSWALWMIAGTEVPLWQAGLPSRWGVLGLGVVALAWWRARRSPPSRLINDTQTDLILTGLLLAFAAAVRWLFVPRLEVMQPAFFASLAILPVVAGGVSLATWGVGTTWHHRWTLASLWLLWPLPYDVASRNVPSSRLGLLVVSVVVVAAASQLSGNPNGRGGARVPLALGALVILLSALPPGTSWSAVLAAVALVIAAPRVVPDDRVRARALGWGAGVAAFVTLVVAIAGDIGDPPALRPLPAGGATTLVGRWCEHLGPAWSVAGVDQVIPANAGADLPPTQACSLRATAGGLASQAYIDLSPAEPPATLASFPFPASFDVRGSEEAYQSRLTLPGGVRAWRLVWVDAGTQSTTVVVTWTSHLAGDPPQTYQRVSVIVLDLPGSTAAAPAAGNDLIGALASRIGALVRVSGAEAKTLAVPPRYAPDATDLAIALADQSAAQPARQDPVA